MNYILQELTFPSSDGIHEIHAEVYLPSSGSYKGIIQLAHGMIDFVERYRNLADFLTGKGYIFAGNDHLGHGKSVVNSDEFGFFASKGGVDYVIEDLHTMNRELRHTYKGLPLILLGHSMGSFIARLYAAKYPRTISALIVHGTAGPNSLLPLGKALAACISALRGERYRSRTVAGMAFAGYNSKFPKSEGKNAWLTRDREAIIGRDEDERSNFIFTVSGYRDLFRFLGGCNSKEWFKDFPKGLPTLIISGDADPVGAYGKGPSYVYKHLLLAGCNNVELKLYEGARHELFNEINRQEVFTDILKWINEVTA